MAAANKKMLVAYYSWTHGNTEKIAEQLADACGADLAHIETVDPYPDDYDATVEQAKDEVNAGFEPQIEPLEFDPADYDVIAVGTPTWWYTMAPAVAAFMHDVDWTRKTVVPFLTNASWAGDAIADMEEAAAGATPGPSLEVLFDSAGGSHQETPQHEVDAWIASVAKLLA